MLHSLFNKLEAPIEALHDLNRCVTNENDGSRLNYVCPAAGDHGVPGVLEGGRLVLGKLDDEEGLLRLIARDLVNNERADEDEGDACEVHKSGNDPAVIEEHACKERDYRELRAAGHEGREHCGCPSFSLVSDGTACHNAWDSAAYRDNEGDNRLARETNLLEDGVKDNCNSGHIAALLKHCDKEVHYHNQRKEADYRANAADNTVNQQGGKKRMSILKKAADPLLEHFNETYKGVCDKRADPGLGNAKHKEHYQTEDWNAEPLVCKDLVDFIVYRAVSCKHLTALNRRHDALNELKAISVRGLDCFLVCHINSCARVGGCLTLSNHGNRGGNKLGKSLAVNRNCVYDFAAKLLGERFCVNNCLLFLVNIALIESEYNRDTQLKKLRCEEEATADIGSVYNVNNYIGVSGFYIVACDALLGCEGGHGVCAGQVYCHKLAFSLIEFFLYWVGLYVNRYACPVAHLLVATRQGVIHSSLARIRVAR